MKALFLLMTVGMDMLAKQ